MPRFRAMAVLTALITAAACPGALAQDAGTPEDLVEYRQAVMSSLGGHAGALARILKGQVDVDHVRRHAEAIAATAPVLDDIWWPNSTYEDHDDTDALPAIWEQPDDFQSRIDRFQAAADDFVEAAGTGERDAILEGFRALGDSCSGCHDNYRYEE